MPLIKFEKKIEIYPNNGIRFESALKRKARRVKTKRM